MIICFDTVGEIYETPKARIPDMITCWLEELMYVIHESTPCDWRFWKRNLWAGEVLKFDYHRCEDYTYLQYNAEAATIRVWD